MILYDNIYEYDIIYDMIWYYIAVPIFVFGPYLAKVISGYQVKAYWKAPYGRTGKLLIFKLRGYDLDRPYLDPIETEFPFSEEKNGSYYNLLATPQHTSPHLI